MLGCIGVIIFAVIIWIVSPILNFFCGYFAGLILSWAVGGTLIDGLNILFNTTRFSADMLPVVFGALAVVGSFFRSSLSNSKKD